MPIDRVSLRLEYKAFYKPVKGETCRDKKAFMSHFFFTSAFTYLLSSYTHPPFHTVYRKHGNKVIFLQGQTQSVS